MAVAEQRFGKASIHPSTKVNPRAISWHTHASLLFRRTFLFPLSNHPGLSLAVIYEYHSLHICMGALR
jgi:hypothetical protein